MTARAAERALAYARHGWPVFPCQPGGKQPATRHGFHDATTDPGKITWWWRRQPEANLAIATGHPGPDVLDVDQHGPAGNGFAALNQLKRAGLIGGASAIVATPSGGLHAYFTGSDQRCGKLPRHHLDFRARGGYILAPPSQVGGRPYRVISHRDASGGLDWAKVTGLLEPERHTAIRPARAQRGDLSHLAGVGGRAGSGQPQPQRRPVLGRLPRRRSRRRDGARRSRGRGPVDRADRPRDRRDDQVCSSHCRAPF